jgi:hypothetical protein
MRAAAAAAAALFACKAGKKGCKAQRPHSVTAITSDFESGNLSSILSGAKNGRLAQLVVASLLYSSLYAKAGESRGFDPHIVQTSNVIENQPHSKKDLAATASGLCDTFILSCLAAQTYIWSICSQIGGCSNSTTKPGHCSKQISCCLSPCAPRCLRCKSATRVS